jgi:hypothetical protein
MYQVIYLTNYIILHCIACIYVCLQNFMLALHCLNSDFTMYITIFFNPKYV